MVRSLPAAKVEQVKKRIRDYEAQGGVKTKDRQSVLKTIFNISKTNNTPQDPNNTEHIPLPSPSIIKSGSNNNETVSSPKSSSSLPVALPVTNNSNTSNNRKATTSSNPFDATGNPFAEEVPSNNTTNNTNNSTVVVAEVRTDPFNSTGSIKSDKPKSPVMVEALYDHQVHY